MSPALSLAPPRMTLVRGCRPFALVLACLSLLAWTASASAATFYVDDGAGANCANDGPGTSPGAPWCDFTPVNAHGAFQPGDHLLLARGAAWSQEMRVTGSGTAENPIVLGAYGEGPRPVVRRDNDPSSRGIRLLNPDYWQVRDLEVAHAAAGVHAVFTTPGHRGLVFQDLDVHDNNGIWHCRDSTGTVDARAVDEHLRNSAGIAVTGNLPFPTGSDVAIRDIRVDHVTGTHNFNTVAFDFVDACRQEPVPLTVDGGVGDNLVQDVVISDVVAHDDDNPMPGHPGCDEGMRLFTMRHVVLKDSVLDQEASCHSRTGTTGMILGRLRDATIVNTIVEHIDDTASPDQGALDYEYLNDTVRVRNSFFAHLAGEGVSYLLFRPDDFQTGHEASGNVFVDTNAAFRVYQKTGTATGTIRDNLTTDPLWREQSGTFAGFTRTGNRSVPGGPADVFYGPEQFSSRQGSDAWSYQQRTDASAWSDLGAFDAGAQAWRGSAGAQVAQFTMRPPCDGGWVARTWTAPATGVVSIRGRALMADNAPGGPGDGVVTRLTLDDRQLWPSGGGARTISGGDEYIGAEQVLDDVAVRRGERLRFVVAAGSGCERNAVSWAPAVAYTTGSGRVVREWSWDRRPDQEGWTGSRDAATRVGNGVLHVTSLGTDPFVFTTAGLRIDAATAPVVRIRMRNGTADRQGRIYFTTTSSPAFSEDKSVPFDVDPESGFVEYVVDMRAAPGWSGTIDRLRVDPVRAPGDVDIDDVRVTRP